MSMGTPFVGSVVVTLKTLRSRRGGSLPADAHLWMGASFMLPLWMGASFTLPLWIADRSALALWTVGGYPGGRPREGSTA